MSENGRLKDSELDPTLLKLGGRLTPKAADAADRMFTKYALDGMGVLQAVSAADLYRTYEQQVEARERVGNLAAKPGTSNHGLGEAADLDGFTSWGSSQQAWFEKNGRDFGWVTPTWAIPGHKDYEKNEPWHKEFREELDEGKGPKIRRPKKGEIGIGSEGDKVERIQILLNQRLSGPNLIVDGKFGLASAVATARFQRQEGLAVVGAVGNITEGLLEGREVKPVTPPKPEANVIYLQRGTKKAAQVKKLQEFLKDKFVPGLVVDGIYLDDTEAAVKIWQKKAGFTPTGKIGEQSQARLVELGVF